MKLKPVVQYIDGPVVGYNIYCPGCKRVHSISTKRGYLKSHWLFNGNEQAPSFTPSILVQYSCPEGFSSNHPAPRDWTGPMVNHVCHSFIKDGMFQFLGDCTHELRGQTVPIPEFRWDEHDDPE